MDRLSNLCDSVTHEQVEKAKTQLKLTWLMDMDGTSPAAEDIGRQMLTYGRRMTPVEVFARTEAITLEQVQPLAFSYNLFFPSYTPTPTVNLPSLVTRCNHSHCPFS